tara:strand:+ start:107 stop:448 length:342 start_codon:yes stop_codon:yes gene_type:complete
MCALCGILVDGPHWTESGTDAGHATSRLNQRELYLERVYRLRILNQILAPFGAVAEDWAGGQYIIRNISGGASDVVPNLPALWKSLESVLNKDVDPLAQEFLSHIEKNNYVLN